MIEEIADSRDPMDDIEPLDDPAEEAFAMAVDVLKVFGIWINGACTLTGLRVRHWAVYRVVCPTVIGDESPAAFARRVGVSKAHVSQNVGKVKELVRGLKAGEGQRAYGRAAHSTPKPNLSRTTHV